MVWHEAERTWKEVRTRHMQLIRSLTVVFAATLSLVSGAANSRPGGIVTFANELPSPVMMEITGEGRAEDGSLLKWRIQRQPKTGNVTVDGWWGSAALGRVILLGSKYELIDIMSSDVTYDLKRKTLTIHLRFGRRSECYLNDDGRSILSILLSPGVSAIKSIPLSSCSPG